MAPRNNNKAARRNLQAAAEETSIPPDTLTSTQTVALVIKATGNNLYSLQTPNGKEILAELQGKFRSTIWIRRGGYVVVDSASEGLADRDNKISGEIINVVRDQKEWRRMSYWYAYLYRRRKDC